MNLKKILVHQYHDGRLQDNRLSKFHLRKKCLKCGWHTLFADKTYQDFNFIGCCPDCGAAKNDKNWTTVSAKVILVDSTKPEKIGVFFKTMSTRLYNKIDRWEESDIDVCDYCGFGEEEHKSGCEGCGA